ncbi:hypothetical protein [Streptomyces sp. NPDC090080]|uniref:hypothetical protein n=1 Tax=Streptomyces sp. NPDC090080 TaxID=3365939 RepID=UPI003813ACEE
MESRHRDAPTDSGDDVGDQENGQTSLDSLTNELRAMHGRVGSLDTRVGTVHSDIVSLRAQLNAVENGLIDLSTTVDRVEDTVRRLDSRLDDFTDRYAKDQARTHAEAELTRLTIDWQARFEQRRQTRALAHGLVNTLTKDSLDRGVVDKDVLAACTHERMLMEPTFWLSPATVALAARYLGREPQMHRARGQAYQLDQARSNLFFSLTSTRLGEQDNAASWMDRYLQSIDPYALDENFHVVLDAVASSELGMQAHALTRQAIGRWVGRLDLAQATTLSKQVLDHMGELGKNLPNKNFQELGRVCTGNWDDLRQGWEWATVPEATLAHLRRAFPGNGDERPAGHAASALDALIDRHDADEAALASRMRYLELVVEHGGDEQTASREHAAQRAAARPVDLRTLLVNAVFVPEAVPLGEDARLLALRAVWPQILDASKAYTDRSRSLLPHQIDFTYEEWRRPVPVDPTAEIPAEPLVHEFRKAIQDRTRHRIASVQLNVLRLVSAAGLATACITTAFLVTRGTIRIAVIVGAVAAALWALAEWRRVPAQRHELNEEGRHAARTGAATLSRALYQRVTFFSTWYDNLESAPQLRTWAETAWRHEKGALEGGTLRDSHEGWGQE